MRSASSVPLRMKITARSACIWSARVAPPSKRGITSIATPVVSVTVSLAASAATSSAAKATVLSGATIGRGTPGSKASPGWGFATTAGGRSRNSSSGRAAARWPATSSAAATLGSAGATPPTTSGGGGGGGDGRSTSGRMRIGGGVAARPPRYAAMRCCARAMSGFAGGMRGSKSTAERLTSP